MYYQLIANSADPDQVEERTIDGERYLVAKNVTFIRPMDLAGGYVPEQSIANSVPAWDERPLTINHPKNLPDRPWYDPDHEGFYVSANAGDEVRRRKVIGHAENPSRNSDGSVDADLAHNVDRLEAIANGGAVAQEDADAAAELLNALEEGRPFDVSSQYLPRPLPPGEYDGEHREEVEAIGNADSIAILPTKDGACSLEDGCGFQPQQATANAEIVRAPVANADSHVPMTPNSQHGDGEDMGAAADATFEPGDLVAWDWSGGTARGRVEEVFVDEGLVTRTLDGTEVSKDSDEQPVYLVDVWSGVADDADGEGEFSGQALRQEGSRNLREWSDPPDELQRGNAASYELTNVSPEDAQDWANEMWTDEEWDGSAAIAAMPNPSESDDAADVLDQTHAAVPADAEARDAKSSWKLPFRTGPDAPVNTRALVAIDAALSGARDGVDGLGEEIRADLDDWVGAMLQAAPEELFGAMDDAQSANALGRFKRQVLDALGIGSSAAAMDTAQDGDEPAESGATPDDTTNGTTSMEDRTAELVANHGFDAANLPEESTECFDRIYEAVTANEDGTDDDGTGEQTANNDDNEFVTHDELDEFKDEIVDAVSANADDGTEDDLAKEIVANSAEYDDPEAVREDYPTEAALRTKRDQLESGGMPGPGGFDGISANDDGPDIDVDSGVLTE
ncbi:DUF2945 domain-containing protein [Halomicroarcula sp. GCM10025709]|uniref:DUF2945 domain-containing protein n=1 Tax=Haloarcula TaxID=2237 RepID=UPI0024C21DD4|nr:DUF2945 domain-containing protein [Halomicroarcula sp. YJ-61-S]